MKIVTLNINNIRGIKSLVLEPNCENIVINGPNGSGKSAVVDAIDFLLTGKISRLTGKGTKDISFLKHGSHIDVKKIEEVSVSAEIKLSGIKENISISRSFDKPNDLAYNHKYKNELESVLSVAKRGQYVLTRKEILKFIASESGKRSEEIQALLNLTKVETVRKTLVKVKNKCEADNKGNNACLIKDKESIMDTVGIIKYDEIIILDFINQNRKILNLNPITEFYDSYILDGCETSRMKEDIKKFNPASIQKYIDIIETLKSDKIDNIRGIHSQIKSQIKELSNKPDELKSFKLIELTNYGLKFMDDYTNCPLCDKEWENGKLKQYLLEKKEKAENTSSIILGLNQKSKEINDVLKLLLSKISSIIDLSKELQIDNSLPLSSNTKDRIIKFQKLIKDNIIDNYPIDSSFDSDINVLFLDDKIIKELKQFHAILTEKYPVDSGEDTALDFLTRLDENLKSYKKSKQNLSSSEIIFNRADLLYNAYIDSKEKILSELYNQIMERFIDLYKELHHEDENGFTAELTQESAVLKLEVDFHGRGNHPPIALHSEGHQDSMGLCLYLSLVDRLVASKMDLIVLDDVVMSVDTEHRKELCNLLKKYYSDKQFIITTHDRAWANQLRYQGVITSKGKIEFYGWNIETGPKVNYLGSIWDQIDRDVDLNHISEAASKLRKFSEEFFFTVCQYLKAKVICKPTADWNLGELLFPAMSKYKDIIKKAKKSAESWNNLDLLADLDELDSTRHQTFIRVAGEQWVLNPCVHYNEWENFTQEEFRSVIDAFKDLFDLFQCHKCSSINKIISTGKKEEILKCNCGHANLNLIIKK